MLSESFFVQLFSSLFHLKHIPHQLCGCFWDDAKHFSVSFEWWSFRCIDSVRNWSRLWSSRFVQRAEQWRRAVFAVHNRTEPCSSFLCVCGDSIDHEQQSARVYSAPRRKPCRLHHSLGRSFQCHVVAALDEIGDALVFFV